MSRYDMMTTSERIVAYSHSIDVWASLRPHSISSLNHCMMLVPHLVFLPFDFVSTSLGNTLSYREKCLGLKENGFLRRG